MFLENHGEQNFNNFIGNLGFPCINLKKREGTGRIKRKIEES